VFGASCLTRRFLKYSLWRLRQPQAQVIAGGVLEILPHTNDAAIRW
jgi:hypothetical protein